MSSRSPEFHVFSGVPPGERVVGIGADAYDFSLRAAFAADLAERIEHPRKLAGLELAPSVPGIQVTGGDLADERRVGKSGALELAGMLERRPLRRPRM